MVKPFIISQKGLVWGLSSIKKVLRDYWGLYLKILSSNEAVLFFMSSIMCVYVSNVSVILL
jgi:hypothetical protein